MHALLNQSLGGQSIIVITHRIKDIVAIHTPETRNEIGLTIRIGMTKVQIPRNRRRRSIDGINRGTGLNRKVIGTRLLPESL